MRDYKVLRYELLLLRYKCTTKGAWIEESIKAGLFGTTKHDGDMTQYLIFFSMYTKYWSLHLFWGKIHMGNICGAFTARIFGKTYRSRKYKKLIQGCKT